MAIRFIERVLTPPSSSDNDLSCLIPYGTSTTRSNYSIVILSFFFLPIGMNDKTKRIVILKVKYLRKLYS